MDPRLLNYKPDYPPPPAKRNASGSPDGAPGVGTRKVTKPNPTNGSSAPATNDSSRRSSVTSVTGRTAAVTTDGRRPSDQLQTELRNTAPINSPDSMGSRYEGVQSGRSTPLTTNGGPVRQNVPPVPQMIEKTTGAIVSNSIFDLLVDFAGHVTEVAATQISKHQCEARLRQATAECNSMSSHFVNFPAIKEMKVTEKRIAETKFSEVETKFNEQLRVQRNQVGGLAALFGSTIAPRSDSNVEQECASLRKTLVDLETRARDRAANDQRRAANADAEISVLRADIKNLQATVLASSSTSAEIGVLRAEVHSLQTSVLASSSTSAGDSAEKQGAADARLDQLETNIQSYDIQLETTISIVQGHVDEQLEEVKLKLDDVVAKTAAGNATTTRALNQVTADLRDVGVKLGHKVDKESAIGTMDAITQQKANGVVPHAAVKQVQDLEALRKEHQALVVRHDGLNRITQNLQKQYNNLTTEEVCAAMMDQFGTIWPHAKNYNNSIVGLQTEMREVRQIAGTATTSATAAHNMACSFGGQLKQLGTQTGGIGRTAQSANTTASMVQRELSEVKSAMSRIEENANQAVSVANATAESSAAATSTAANNMAANTTTGIIQEEIQAFKDQVAAIERKAEEAHRLASDKALVASNNDIAMKEIGKLGKEVKGLAEQLSGGRDTLAAGGQDLTRLNTEMKQLKERLALAEMKMEVLGS
ncbi:hypothetical protein LTR08_003078 [Meristemomyces frigidus]|nr:hypothetical protein LTR08_003078 [Meristemomyces frigidus]